MGTGVLGPVYRARESDGDRTVAIKAFELDLTPEQVEIFGNALADIVNVELSHPAIVAPLAAGLESGMPFMAYEYVAAESLDVVLRREARPPEALEWIAALAGAVDAAHARGVVHGALHLRDVLVSPEGICATGFGIASALAHVRLGVPVRRPYTADEVPSGRRWGPPADRFSLAVLAYELLTGTRPSGSGDEAIADLRELCPDAADPAGLQQAFRNALAGEPAIRSASATAFVTALAHAIGDQALQGPPLAGPGGGPLPDRALDSLDETPEPAHGTEFADIGREARDLAFDVPESVVPVEDEPFGRARTPAQPVQIALPDAADAPAGRTGGGEDPDDVVLRGRGEPASGPPRATASPRRPRPRAGAPRRGGPVVAVRDDVHFDPLDDPDAVEPRAGQADYDDDVPPPPAPTSMRTMAPVIAAVTLGVLVAYLLFTGLWGSGEEMAGGPAEPAGTAATGVEWSEETVAPPASPPPLSVVGEPLALVEEPVVPVGDAPLGGVEPPRPVVPPVPPPPAPDDFPAPAPRAADADPPPASPPPSAAVPPAAPGIAAPPPGRSSPAAGAGPGDAGPVAGSLRVESRPSGATVSVDDVVLGVTPVLISDVSPGARQVRIELPGYRPWVAEVDVSGAEPIRVGASLAPEGGR